MMETVSLRSGRESSSRVSSFSLEASDSGELASDAPRFGTVVGDFYWLR